MVSLFNLDTSIPLIRDDKNYINYLTPKISFKFNPSDMKNYSDSSNQIDTGNIFPIIDWDLMILLKQEGP